MVRKNTQTFAKNKQILNYMSNILLHTNKIFKNIVQMHIAIEYNCLSNTYIANIERRYARLQQRNFTKLYKFVDTTHEIGK